MTKPKNSYCAEDGNTSHEVDDGRLNLLNQPIVTEKSVDLLSLSEDNFKNDDLFSETSSLVSVYMYDYPDMKRDNAIETTNILEIRSCADKNKSLDSHSATFGKDNTDTVDDQSETSSLVSVFIGDFSDIEDDDNEMINILEIRSCADKNKSLYSHSMMVDDKSECSYVISATSASKNATKNISEIRFNANTTDGLVDANLKALEMHDQTETSSLITIVTYKDDAESDDNETTDLPEIQINEETIQSTDRVRYVDDWLEVHSVSSFQCSDNKNNEEFVSSQSANTNSEAQTNENVLSGRRIVEIKLMFEQIKERHSDSCSFEDMILKLEKRKGLKSTFVFECTVCGFEKSVTSCNEDVPINLNSCATLGVTAIGLGSYHLNEFCANLQIPTMSDYMFDKSHKIQQEDWYLLAKEEALKALREEIRLAILHGDVDSAGNALIVVVVDGSWPKRSYGKNFNSLSGCAVIIGIRTNKVIYFDTKDKYCHICTIAKSKNVEPREHECNTNYTGPSSSMETAIIVEGFKYCETLGARMKEMVSDGDTSTYKTINEMNLYSNPSMSVEKDECCNHLYRNFRTAFEATVKKRKCNSKKYITRKRGNDICLGVQSAAKHWRNSTVDSIEKLLNLEKDVLNAPLHYFGVHDNCAEYFCTKTTEPDAREVVDLLKSDDIFDKIMNLCQIYFASSVPSLLLNYNNNRAESFNNLVAKYIGGKRIQYCLSKSYRMRVSRSVVQYNTDGRSGSTYHEFKGSTVPESLTTLEKSRKRKLEKNAVAKATKPKKSRFSEQVIDKGVSHGDGPQDKDMAPNIYEIAKTQFLESLHEDQQNREHINNTTLGQHLNKNWRDKRRKLLTSWYFSIIINARGPKSYTNILNDIMYKDLERCNNADQVHQRIYEKQGFKCFSLVHRPEYASECGLIIDIEHCFLGTSPFRLYGENAIVLIKCPLKAYKQRSIQEAITKNFIKIFKIVKGKVTVNKKSPWYIEVQGQLHITRRSLAYLVVWIESEYQIEQIERDDLFWEKTMEKSLVYFYENVMLKELVNPRKERHMELRTYNPTSKSFE